MRIAVVGSGYVGLVSAACFAELGHEVVCIDNDQEKLAILRKGGVTIHENLLPELLKRHVGQRLTFSDSLAEGIEQANVVFITVGTPPSATGEADLSYVEVVARDIALNLHSKKLVVEKSTVPVQTCDQVRRVMQLHGVSSELFSVASNPEFLRKAPQWSTSSIPIESFSASMTVSPPASCRTSMHRFLTAAITSAKIAFLAQKKPRCG